MSKEAVVKLLNEADEGSALRRELEAALESPGGKADAFLKVAATHGLEFTLEEFKAVLAEASAEPQEGELSDDDLEQVAGGVGVVRLPVRNLKWAFRLGPRIHSLGQAPPPEFGGGGGPPPP